MMADILVNSLGLSVVAINALNKMQIHTLEQLLNTPIDEIRQGKNIGEKTVVEIENLCKNYLDGTVDIDLLANKETVIKKINRAFSEDELEEMSHHSITELQLSARAENGLLRIGCGCLSKLAKLSEQDLRNIDGLGTKTCDEILKKKEVWISSNLYISDYEEKSETISEKEKTFYERLAVILSPIKRIFWRQLRNLLLKNNIMQQEDDFSLLRIDKKFIYMIIKLSEFNSPLKDYLKKIMPEEIIRIDNLEDKITIDNLEIDATVLLEHILGDRICKQKDKYIYIDKLTVMQYLKKCESDFEPLKYDAFIRRLKGCSLQEIGDALNLTRERVRQILTKMAKSMPTLYEDYYRFPYEFFKFTKSEFCNAFPECGAIGYEYLFMRYKKGKNLIDDNSVKKYIGIWSERMEEYLKEEALRQDKRHVTRTEMVYRVLMSNSDCAMTMDEFEEKYYEYLTRRNYPKDRLAINIRTVSNHLRNSQHVVFDKDNRVRYCEVSPQIIWENIDFNRYKDNMGDDDLLQEEFF